MTAVAGSIHPVMVGTAGHIDHGKSSLVRALTGIDPDRLKEEKERGMTIDLGFAPLRLADGRTLGVIDVPGHERFVRNMVAGSTSLDIAILVIAADDGVMPQTREHLDILDLLGVRRGIVALTKVDLVDEEIAALAAEEVAGLLRGTVLQDAEILPVSSVTGEGLDRLRKQLEVLALQTPPKAAGGPFRMPIQRVFTLKGIGTVVAGVPVSGSIHGGQEVEVLPPGVRLRVRALQAFGRDVGEAVAGHSTALSVPDAREAGLARGMVVGEPGVYHVGDAIDVELRLLRRAAPLAHRHLVRFHTGTLEVQGTLLLLDRERAEPGAELFARIELDEPICCAPMDRFLLRTQTPPVTVGGGSVLRLTTVPKHYRRKEVAAELERLRAAGGSLEARVREELAQAGAAGRTPAEIAAALASDALQVQRLVQSDPELHWHERGGRAFTRRDVDEGVRELHAAVARMLKDRPLAASIKRSALRATRTLPAPLQDALFDLLAERGEVRAATLGRVLFVGRLQPLPTGDQQLLDRLVGRCEDLGHRPPTAPELAAHLGIQAEALAGLLARAIDEGRVEQVGEHVYGARLIQQTLASIRRNCQQHDGVLDIPQLRDELQTSRKFLIPLLEHVDSLGLTILRGGVRRLLASSPLNAELEALGRA
jgi:selenocysteine-specific elongation factor